MAKKFFYVFINSMNILPINNDYKYLYNTGINKSKRNNASDSKIVIASDLLKNEFNPICYKPYFLGRTVHHNSLWKNYIMEFQKNYPNEQMTDVILISYQNKENIIGEGSEKFVFTIPKVKSYVAAYLKRVPETNYNKPFKAGNLTESEYYFGEPIGGNGKFIIMKRINGESYSINDWFNKYFDVILGKQPVTQDDARNFVRKIREVASFPIESYIDIQKQLKFLTDRNIRIDSINPGNVIVDKETQRMHLIDLSKQLPEFATLNPQVNCSMDIADLLTDCILNTKYLSVLPPQESAELMQLTKQVISKSIEAGKIVGLSDKKDIAEQFYDIIQKIWIKNKKFNPCLNELYKEFVQQYNL